MNYYLVGIIIVVGIFFVFLAIWRSGNFMDVDNKIPLLVKLHRNGYVFVQFVGIAISIFMIIISDILIAQLIVKVANQNEIVPINVEISKEYVGANNKLKNNDKNIASVVDDGVIENRMRREDEKVSRNNAGTVDNNGDEKDVVSNAMTAVATSITAIMLMLGLGTTWFGNKLKELDWRRKQIDSEINKVKGMKKDTEELSNNMQKKSLEIEEKLKDLAEKTAEIESRTKKRDMAVIHFYAAYESMLNYLQGLGPNEGARIAESLKFHLELFVCEDISERRKAFWKMAEYLKVEDYYNNKVSIQNIKDYLDFCHEQLHGGKRNIPGNWCLLFSREERDLYFQETVGEVIY